MDISDEVRQQIGRLVRGGFEDEAGIHEVICEEIFEEEDLDPDEVTKAIKNEIAQQAKEKASWPKVTDCDRLFQVFDALNQKGVIALHRAGLTQDEGYEMFREEWSEQRNSKRIEGYCFYTGQDLEGAFAKRGLYLAFGPVLPKGETTEGPRIGQVVVDELKKAGLKVSWDGSMTSRIHLPDFDWKRR